MNPTFRLGAAILAAGASSRMGRPKMLLPWRQTTVIGHLVAIWSGLGQVAVVVGPGANPVAGELDRLGFPVEERIVNPAPEQGMFSSIRCAAKWEGWPADLTHWAIVLGDQPQVSDAALRALMELARENPASVCQLSLAGQARHPVILPRAVFRELRDSPAANLREFLAPFPRVFREAPDDSAEHDLDFPEDYEKAVARWPAGTK